MATLLQQAGVLAGLLGSALWALALASSLRWRPLELLTKGLDGLYRIHHALGLAGFLLVLAHPLLLALARNASAPGHGWEVLFSSQRFTLLGWGSLVLVLLCANAIYGLHRAHRLARYLHMLGWPALFLGLAHGADARGAMGGWALFIVALAGAALVTRLVLLGLPSARYEYRVHSVRRLSPDVTVFRLAAEGRALRFEPGQFVDVRFYDPHRNWRCTEYHPFTITSAPDAPFLELVVKGCGDCTRKLVLLPEGALAHLRGPFGRLFHKGDGEPDAHQIWIAGGVGIAPFLARARQLMAASNGAPHSKPSGDPKSPSRKPTPSSIELFYCANTEAEAYFAPELRELERRLDNFRVVTHFLDRNGFLTAERVAAESGDLHRAQIFLSGPPAMLRGLKPKLLNQGASPQRVHLEALEFL